MPPRLCDRIDCPTSVHDTYSAHRSGCRSEAACEESRLYRKRLRLAINRDRMVAAIGVQRRIRALQALGWRQEDIGEVAGIPSKSFARILRESTVHERTATRLKRAFERLSMELGPSELTRGLAQKRGWAVPLAYDNIDDPGEVPVGQRAPQRKRPDRPRGQRRYRDRTVVEQVAEMTARHRGAAEIGRSLGITARTVVRIRAELRAGEAA